MVWKFIEQQRTKHYEAMQTNGKSMNINETYDTSGYTLKCNGIERDLMNDTCKCDEKQCKNDEKQYKSRKNNENT